MLAGVLVPALHMLVNGVAASTFCSGRRQRSSHSHLPLATSLNAAAIIAQPVSGREFLLCRGLCYLS